jgi:3,4-dihydroxy 2-butanone 4-phosphate synthase/GTP cyclohydrolase II
MTDSNHKYLSSIPEIIAEAKKGNMFILVDDENRENEGDLVVPAQMCDDQKINFMIKNCRGLVCLALSEDRVRQLELPLMSLNNQSRHKTAFTISIEARSGISTGISAFDRAKTIRDAIDPNKNKNDIVSPGHIFPLRAVDGGVLVRAGHTEAAVDISRLAGLNHSGVICEIMNDDGTMARLPDLIKFAKQHQLKIATIADLIEYRRKNEKLIEIVQKSKFTSNLAKNLKAEFDLVIYKSKVDNIEHIVLKKGQIKKDQPVLVRMHHLNILNDCLNDADSQKSGLLIESLKKIVKNGSGVAVIIRQPSESLTEIMNNNSDNISKTNKELRNYGIGAQILLDLGIKNMILLTNSKKSVIGLEGYGIKICGYESIMSRDK